MRNETSYPAKKQTAEFASIDEITTDPKQLRLLEAHLQAKGFKTLSISIKDKKALGKKTLLQVLEAGGFIRAVANAGIKELIFEKCTDVGFPQSALLYKSFDRITVIPSEVMAVQVYSNINYFRDKARLVQEDFKRFGDCKFYFQTPLQQEEMQFNTNPA